jgi:hypothetical protein
LCAVAPNLPMRNRYIAAQPAAPESSAMLIDAHVHIGRDPTTAGTAQHLADYLSACQVSTALVSNVDAAALPAGAANLDETDAALAVLRFTRARRGALPLYWTRPGRPDSHPYALAGALLEDDFRGAVFSPALNDFAADDVELLKPYLQVLERVGVAAVFHTARDERAAPSKIYALARKFPAVPFLLYGAAADVHLHEALDCVKRAASRGDAQLYVETARTSGDEALALVRSAGPDRVLFGSDAPYYAADHAQRSRAVIEQLRAQLPAEAATRVLSQNAARIFRLDRAPRAAAQPAPAAAS